MRQKLFLEKDMTAAVDGNNNGPEKDEAPNERRISEENDDGAGTSDPVAAAAQREREEETNVGGEDDGDDDSDNDVLRQPGAVRVLGIGRRDDDDRSRQGSENSRNSGGGAPEEVLVTARVVDDEEIRLQVEREILGRAASAEAVLEQAADPKADRRRQILRLAALLASVAVVVAAILGAFFGATRGRDEPQSQPQTPAPTNSFAPSPPPSAAPSVAPTRELRWAQVGQELEGNGEFHYFGTSVDIASDGKAIAVGGTPDNPQQSAAEIYQLDTDTGNWALRGNRIPIPTPSGFKWVADSVFLNDQATKLHLLSGQDDQLYTYDLQSDSQAWLLRKQVFNASNLSPRSQRKINVTSIGKLTMSSGRRFMALVFTDDQSKKVVQAFTSDGIWRGYPLASTGRRPAISADGRRIVVDVDGNATVLDYGDSPGTRFDWVQPGTQLINDGNRSGSEVAISGDGSTVAVDVNNRGIVVFRYTDAGEWKQIGRDIADYSGGPGLSDDPQLYLSNDGNLVAAKEIGSGFVNRQAYLRTFRLVDDEMWEEYDRIHDSETDELACALAGDGMSAVCGWPNYFETGSDTHWLGNCPPAGKIEVLRD